MSPMPTSRMLQEIRQQPAVLERSLQGELPTARELRRIFAQNSLDSSCWLRVEALTMPHNLPVIFYKIPALVGLAELLSSGVFTNAELAFS
jgi:hypothetical protein